jgi:hypothetical protein
MCPYDSHDRDLPTGTDAYYEAIASQEEIYLEEIEEELRMVLESDDSFPLPNKSVNQQQCIAEVLITGDSDNPPLSEKAILEMLRAT